MNTSNKITIISCIICCTFIACILGYCSNELKKYEKQIIILNEQIEKYKQAANPSKETIDSLVYNIEYRDTIIYNIKHKYINDVEIIKNMPDSVAVDVFNKLVWSD